MTRFPFLFHISLQVNQHKSPNSTTLNKSSDDLEVFDDLIIFDQCKESTHDQDQTEEDEENDFKKESSIDKIVTAKKIKFDK